MKKVLANDGISSAGKDRLEQAGFTVSTDKVAQEDLGSVINAEGYSALLVRSATQVRKDLIDACPDLDFIGRGGVGMDNIDVEYARNLGRRVENTPGASSRSVGELVMAHMFASARFLNQSYCDMPELGAKDFKRLKKAYAKGKELGGRTLGVVGFGRIGQETAKLGVGAGMKVIAFDPISEQDTLHLDIIGLDEPVQVPIERVSMDDLLSRSDFISLHVPAQEDGSAVIAQEQFGKMKDGVVLVNAARGGVVDESALIEALDSGKVGSACLDVFVGEPEPRTDVLTHEKVASSPHIGAATMEAQERIGLELAEKIINHFGD
jgi:D-3-phosphoglycerate dehydrogenase